MKWRAPCSDPSPRSVSGPPPPPPREFLPGGELCFLSGLPLREPAGLELRPVEGLEGPLLRGQSAHLLIHRALLGLRGPLWGAAHPTQLGLCLMPMLRGNARAFWLTPPRLRFIINSEDAERRLFLLSTHVLRLRRCHRHGGPADRRWAPSSSLPPAAREDGSRTLFGVYLEGAGNTSRGERIQKTGH